jgi:3-phosphoshikimate 1-carboxyvinyltransferase
LTDGGRGSAASETAGSAAADRSRYEVRPGGSLRGEIGIPGDKSISHRALILSALASGTSHLQGVLAGADCMATAAALRALGVVIEPVDEAVWRVHGVGLRGLQPAAQPLDLGNSGTGMRLLTGLLAAQDFDSELVGDASLMQRPMERVAVPLREMGASVETNAGRPPVRIRGGRSLKGIRYATPVASAQLKSAIILAGLYASGSTRVDEPGVTRDHTERMLESFGVRVERDACRVEIWPSAGFAARDIAIPGDFSSAAFFIVAACLNAAPGFVIRDVGINPTRTGLLDILRLMGARIRCVNVRRSGAEPVADLQVERASLKGIEVPAELVPNAIDEFPILCVAAACAEGATRFSGAQELRVKESDRIRAMAAGLGELGAEVEEFPDGLRIVGGRLRAGTVDSFGDHRVAMAFAIAGQVADGPVRVCGVGNVATSFPGFARLAGEAGLRLEEIGADG